MRIAAHGLALDNPVGWDARIRKYDQTAAPTESPGPQFRSHAVLHAADFALPEERGDFGSGAVEIMGPTSAFLALLEYHPDSARTALFSSNAGMPQQVSIDDFSSRQLQRTIRGQGGAQFFFAEGGRAFCLYMVLGSLANRRHAVPRLNTILSAIEITPRPGREWEELV